MIKFLALVLAGSLCVTPLIAQAKVIVFACEPEWAALAQELGGKRVKAFSATHAKQDPHYIRARPSLIARARNADLFVCSGGGLEVGWLPLLLQKARTDVQPGTVGYLMASEYVPVIEKPVLVDRSMGDVHPEGNPHVHLNPHNVLLVGKELADRMKSIDAENADFFQNRLADFEVRWRQAIMRWEEQANYLKGSSVVVHHKAFSYLNNWLGLNEVASLEPKPGIPPSIRHLEGLLQLLSAQSADMIIRTPYEPHDASEWLAEKTGTPALILPYTVGGDSEAGDLFALFDRSFVLLKGALRDQ